MKRNLEYFPGNLKKLRKDNKLSQEEVAKVLGLVKSLISRYENGKAEPLFSNVVKLAQFFGVTIDSLLESPDKVRSAEDNLHELKSIPAEYIAVLRLAISYDIPVDHLKSLVQIAGAMKEGK